MSTFDEKVAESMPEGLRGSSIDTMQVNIGRQCNLACNHCHLECSPTREERMDWSIMQAVVKAAAGAECTVVDITGGSPELHPDFRPFISALRDAELSIQVRTNLVVLLDPEAMDIMKFLCIKGVRLMATLPSYEEEHVDAQRGEGVYASCIEALLQLNELGYGVDAELPLTLVCHPVGPTLPAKQKRLQTAFRRELRKRHDIRFTDLVSVTNVPIGRFASQLGRGMRRKRYLAELKAAFNRKTLGKLMCRHQVCVDWDGRLYDCDFNIGLGVPVHESVPATIMDFDDATLAKRPVVTGEHCFACTAGCGSSCSGQLL